MSKNTDLSTMIKEARKKKGISARELAKLCDVSHTEINNIENGVRMKPALLTLKGFEKYLDLDFKTIAKLVGYADETIKYGEENIIVSYEMFDKVIDDYREERKRMLYIIEQKRHLAIDTKEYFDVIHNYLNKQDNVDKEILKKADSVDKLLNDITKKYDNNTK